MWVVEKICVNRTNLPLPVMKYSFKMGDILFGDKMPLGKNKKIFLCPNVITPDTIPEFCIPPKIPSQQEPRNVGPSKPSAPTKASPQRASPRKEAVARELISTHIIQVETVDEMPFDDGCSDEESTNADPQSQAALSLPHLAKAQTCYGFCTLLESPHTRRKESLFHSDPGPCGVPLMLPRNTSSNKTSLSSSLNLNILTSRLSPRRILDSDITSSAESSPFCSPLLARPPPKSFLFKALSRERLLSRSAKRTMLSRNSSLSTDEGSSTDNSPSIIRRSSAGIGESLSCSFGLAPPTILPMDIVVYGDRVIKESLVPLGQDGTLRLSLEYSPENQRLRVRLISAQGLYPSSVDPEIISCCISISLVPGKVQKQRSTIIRRSRNPIFNEDFFFDGIPDEEVCHRSLRFKVVNKMSTMKRDCSLGDCEFPLTFL